MESSNNNNSMRIVVNYKECLKNHAANTGKYVVDGCREFMPTGEHGTSLALVCAACCCHRSFHRKEVDSEVPSYSSSASSSTTA